MVGNKAGGLFWLAIRLMQAEGDTGRDLNSTRIFARATVLGLPR